MSNLHTSPNRSPLFAEAMLVLTLLQGSSFTLSLVFRGPLASNTLISVVSLIWMAMYAFALAGLFISFGMNWITWIIRYRLLLTFVLAGVAFSVSWSVDTALTLERAIHLFGTTIIALYLGFSLPLNRILRISATIFGFCMLSSIFVALFVPELGLEDYQGVQVWAGTLAAKNTLGFWAAVTILLTVSMCFWTITTPARLYYLFIAALAFVCLYYSVSATSLVALIAGALVMLYLHATFSLRLNLPSVLMLGLLVASLLWIAAHFIDVAELSGRSGDLTGRGEVWAQTWELILQRPLTGYGYGTLWFPTLETLHIQQTLTDFTWTVYHAHNGLLQIASEIGLPLTMLVILMILQQLLEITYCQYRQQQPGVLFVMGFTVALLVSNYSEARLLINRDLYWIFFIALPVSMLQQMSGMMAGESYQRATAQFTDNTPYRLREARRRKEQKIIAKERIKRLSGIKVINPTDTGSPVMSAATAQSVASPAVQQRTGLPAVPDQQPSTEKRRVDDTTPSRSIVATKISRSAAKSKALQLKKNRHQNRTG